MPTPIVGQPAYQVVATSPHIQRFGVHRVSVTIRDIPVFNHNGLTNTPTFWGTGVLPEGSVMEYMSDGNWYIYGVTTGGPTPNWMSLAAGGIPLLAILTDPYDTTLNGAGNPIMANAYTSGCFMQSFLQFAIGTSYAITGIASVASLLRANGFVIEGTTQVVTGAYPGTYGPSIPMEDAPV